MGFKKRQKAIIIGSGDEMKELIEEVNNNSRYSLVFVSSIDVNDVSDIDFQEEIVKKVYSEDIHVIAVDMLNDKVETLLPHLYNLIFSHVHFIEMYKIYEDIFDRVPLSLVEYSWFLENVSFSPKVTYDFMKRVMDIAVSFIVGLVSLVIYPLVFVAIKLDDKGPVFFTQYRVGKNNRIIKVVKFRSMPIHSNENGLAGNKKITDAFLKEKGFHSWKDFLKAIGGEKVELKKLGIKPVFRLKPPKKGFGRRGIKKPYSIGGALGYRASDINDLISRMI